MDHTTLHLIESGKRNPTLATLILLYGYSHEYLEHAEVLDLTSVVANKTYFAFKNREKHTRAVNDGLFIREKDQVVDRLHDLLLHPFSDQMSSEEITKVVYSSAMFFCCANDLRSKNDQKHPGPFLSISFKFCLPCTCDVPPKQACLL